MFGEWLEETVQTRKRKVPAPLTLLGWGYLAGWVSAAIFIGGWWLAVQAGW